MGLLSIFLENHKKYHFPAPTISTGELLPFFFHHMLHQTRFSFCDHAPQCLARFPFELKRNSKCMPHKSHASLNELWHNCQSVLQQSPAPGSFGGTGHAPPPRDLFDGPESIAAPENVPRDAPRKPTSRREAAPAPRPSGATTTSVRAAAPRAGDKGHQGVEDEFATLLRAHEAEQRARERERQATVRAALASLSFEELLLQGP
eukprot:EG_transcript_23159